jgi:type III pantothenate kinase
MKLLIDLGNSRLKCGLWDGGILQRGGALAHAGVDTGRNGEVDFSALWKDIPAPSAIWIASVASTALEHNLHRSLAEHFTAPIRSARSPAMACGVRNAYSAPARLGVDRFLGLVAMHALAPGATVVASCGTALTLDAIGRDGVHLGGLIAPAPALMRSALLDNTARLGELQASAQVVDFADTTAAAVESGTWLAATALVERFLARASQTLGTQAELVLSGGGAKRLAALLEVPHRIEPDLVLRGLAEFADHA